MVKMTEFERHLLHRIDHLASSIVVLACAIAQPEDEATAAKITDVIAKLNAQTEKMNAAVDEFTPRVD